MAWCPLPVSSGIEQTLAHAAAHLVRRALLPPPAGGSKAADTTPPGVRRAPRTAAKSAKPRASRAGCGDLNLDLDLDLDRDRNLHLDLERSPLARDLNLDLEQSPLAVTMTPRAATG